MKTDFIKRRLFLTYGLVVLLIHLLLYISGAQYDSGRLVGLLIHAYPIWGVIYWAPHEIIFSINDGVAIEGQRVISVLIGLAICLLADCLLNSIRKKRGAIPSSI